MHFEKLKDDSLNIDTIVDTAVKSIEDPDLAAATRTVAKECATKIVGLKRFVHTVKLQYFAHNTTILFNF